MNIFLTISDNLVYFFNVRNLQETILQFSTHFQKEYSEYSISVLHIDYFTVVYETNVYAQNTFLRIDS